MSITKPLIGRTRMATVAVAASLALVAPAATLSASAAPAAATTSVVTAAATTNALRVLHATGVDTTLRARTVALTGDPAACAVANPMDDWLTAQIADWTPADMQLAITASEIVTYDALLNPQPAVFGTHGEYTRTILKTEQKLFAFWPGDGLGVQVVPMHGYNLLDTSRTSKVFQYMGLSAADAQAAADALAAAINTPTFDYGRHPVLSLNAFAVSAGEVGPTPTIVMGDGLLDAYAAVGLGDVAPQMVLAHEYGHQLQFAYGLMPAGAITPEASRRMELMADAFGAYFLSHPKGLSMQQKRIAEAVTSAFDAGDCYFNSTGHHGTPAQRAAAATWAYQLQESTRPKSKVIDPVTFATLFDAALPQIVG